MVTQETMYQKYCTVAQILERVHRFQETIYQEILYGSPGFGECTLCPRNYISGNPAGFEKSTLCTSNNISGNSAL